MNRSQLYAQVADMLNAKPGSNGKISPTKVGTETENGVKANSKSGMSNHNVRTTNKQNPNKTYPASIVAKATERIGGH